MSDPMDEEGQCILSQLCVVGRMKKNYGKRWLGGNHPEWMKHDDMYESSEHIISQVRKIDSPSRISLARLHFSS